MKILGYADQVRLYAMDNLAYDSLNSMMENGTLGNNQAFVVRNAIFIKPGSKYKPPDLNMIWKYRLETIYYLLLAGWTVMLDLIRLAG